MIEGVSKGLSEGVNKGVSEEVSEGLSEEWVIEWGSARVSEGGRD